MNVIRFAIDNPVKITVGVLWLIMFGAISVLTIPIQLVPNVDQPVIKITTDWTGRSPLEVEQQIVEEQEDKLKSVTGVDRMKAIASQGQSEIELEFVIGTDMRRALQEVSDKLREVPEYPDDVDEPVIAVADGASENAIAWMVLTAADPEFDVEQIRDVAEDRIKPLLERVDGLSEVNVYGGRDREVHVRLDPARLADRGITFAEVRDILRLTNVNVSAGDLEDGHRDVRIRTVGQYDDLEQIRRTIVAYDDGGPVQVGDLGEVVLTLARRRSFVRARAQPAIALNAIRESGANVLRVMRGSADGRMLGLQQRIELVNERILANLGHGLRLQQVYDETIYIDDAISLVVRSLGFGGLLAAIVLLLFLRTIRPTLIVSLAIPVCVVSTFIVMWGSGRTLNVVSLAGLAFAVGMVVDNAIVVLENIDRHLGLGKRPARAAYDGAKEVWGAILASTLTTLAVFFPVIFMEEEAGQLFRDIAIAIIASVTLSLVVAVMVIPSASARWLRRRDPSAAASAGRALFGVTPWLERRRDRFAGIIHALTGPDPGRRALRGLIVVVLMAASLLGSWLLLPPASYLPDGNRNLVFGIMLTPPAYSIAHNETIAHRVEASIEDYWKAETLEEAARLPKATLMLGPGQFAQVACPPIENYFFVTFGGTVFMGASSGAKQIVRPLSGLLTGAMNQVPGAIGFAFQPSIFGRGVSGGNAIEVEVAGADIAGVRRSADALYQRLGQQFGYGSIRPDPINFNQPGPELQVRPDPVRAAALRVNVSTLGMTVQTLVDGVIIGDYRVGGESIDVVMIRDPSIALSVDSVGMTPVVARNADGTDDIVPLSAVTTMTRSDSPQSIRRIEEQRAVSLSVRLPNEIPLEQAAIEIDGMVEQLTEAGAIERGVQVDATGSASKLTQVRQAVTGVWEGWSWPSLRSVGLSRFAIALLVTYLLMAALFESFLLPVVIMVTVPMAMLGGFAALAVTSAVTALDPLVPTQQLDVITMLGFVILVGVVVNNAILLVHQALNFMRGEGDTADGATATRLSPRDAIRESVRTRLRPVFMTTLTSVFGMLPLVLMPGSGSELYRGLASVLVGGLLVATIFTLLVVPLLLSLTFDVMSALGSPLLASRSPEP
ncbi:MAG: acriflavin resistance protein [Phycisphaeraceae bacterium]|nr:acriflavin resistance protein [Phycisphaeraceae bacterium]